MKNFKYIIYKEGNYYVSQCLNIDVSSFGNTVTEAIDNLKEALTLFYEEDNAKDNYIKIEETLIGDTQLDVL